MSSCIESSPQKNLQTSRSKYVSSALQFFGVGISFGVPSWLLAQVIQSPVLWIPPLGWLNIFSTNSLGAASGNSLPSSSESFRVDTTFTVCCSTGIALVKNRSARSLGCLRSLNGPVLSFHTCFGFLIGDWPPGPLADYWKIQTWQHLALSASPPFLLPIFCDISSAALQVSQSSNALLIDYLLRLRQMTTQLGYLWYLVQYLVNFLNFR